jgi:hypothetical protein
MLYMHKSVKYQRIEAMRVLLVFINCYIFFNSILTEKHCIVFFKIPGGETFLRLTPEVVFSSRSF